MANLKTLQFVTDGCMKGQVFIHKYPTKTDFVAQSLMGSLWQLLFLRILALSLQAKDVYALVRYVRTDDSSPKLGVLIPHIGKQIWCAWIQLPFKEDVREYSFTTLAPLLLNPGSNSQTPSWNETSSASRVESGWVVEFWRGET
ncbi:UNVERIFIED_CONTAM: hypothetical protein HDU68_011594 [Siphonaria sp. JEL0065]|nr:hypothetical protein HDU68_011594 [Siphonaria sp. JEL0065]